MAIQIEHHTPGVDLEAFIRRPDEIYQTDPAWVAPLHRHQEALDPGEQPILRARRCRPVHGASPRLRRGTHLGASRPRQDQLSSYSARRRRTCAHLQLLGFSSAQIDTAICVARSWRTTRSSHWRRRASPPGAELLSNRSVDHQVVRPRERRVERASAGLESHRRAGSLSRLHLRITETVARSLTHIRVDEPPPKHTLALHPDSLQKPCRCRVLDVAHGPHAVDLRLR